MKWSGRPYHLGVLFKQKLDAIKNGLHSRKSKNEVTWSQMNHTLSLRARKKLESLWRKATKWQYFCSDDQLVNRSYGHVVSRLARQSRAPQLFPTIWHGGGQVAGRETVVASLTTSIPSVGNLFTSPPGSWSLPPRSPQQLPPSLLPLVLFPRRLPGCAAPGVREVCPRPVSLARSLKEPPVSRIRGCGASVTNQPTHPLPEKFQPNEKYILSWNIPLSERFCSKAGTCVHRAFSWGSKSCWLEKKQPVAAWFFNRR